LAAWHRKEGSRDPRRWSGSLSQTEGQPSPSTGYADGSLIRGIEQNTGSQALLTLEEILLTRKGSRAPDGGGPASRKSSAITAG